MRIEGENGGCRSRRSRSFQHALKELLVAEMNAVKIPDGNNGAGWECAESRISRITRIMTSRVYNSRASPS